MKYDKNLLKIIEDKKFKTFWHCLDYLLMAGYSAIEAFGITLKHFGEGKIFSSVAFIRMEKWMNHIMLGAGHNDTQVRRPFLIIGLIDDTNIHLDGLYSVYRSMINDNISSSPEIEETCEVIKSSELTPVIINYLSNQSERHFGIKSFVMSKQMTVVNPPINYRPDPNNPLLSRDRDNEEAKIINFSQEMQKKRNREQL
jgi:hypothetical protein